MVYVPSKSIFGFLEGEEGKSSVGRLWRWTSFFGEAGGGGDRWWWGVSNGPPSISNAAGLGGACLKGDAGLGGNCFTGDTGLVSSFFGDGNLI